MASSLRQFCRHIQKHAFFVVRFNIQYPRNSPWEVHMKCRWTLQKFSLMKLILQLICIVSFNSQSSPGTPFSQVSRCPTFPQAGQLPKLLSSRHIRNSLSVYIFLNSELQLGKSKEFNNQELKVNRNLNAIFFFCHQKTIKNRKALHGIIRA